MRLEQPSLPVFARALNRGGRALSRRGMPLVQLAEGPLLEAAGRQTGLTDFGDESFREPLRLLLDSFETEARLTFLGRIAARQDMVRLLATRLLIEEDRKRHPEIGREKIRRPLFITGLPRTGTTLLHGLLMQDPANRVPLGWETMYPSPPPERATFRSDRRIALAERQLRWFYRLAPEFRAIHPLGARLAQECLVITSHAFMSFQFQTSHRVPTYQAWLERQDLRPAYEYHRRFLQHLQWQCPAERWVLKAPAHLYGIEALFAVYPDAGVILTHRDPLEVAASVASLTAVLRGAFSDAVDPRAVGAEMTARWAEGIARALAARDAGCAPPERFLDVRYADLVRDPIGTVHRIYAHFDLPLSHEAETRIRRFLAHNPKDKHGRHRYSLAQFGLDRDRETQRYAAYRNRFGV